MNVNHTSGRVASDFHHRSAEDIELPFVVEVPLDCRHASIPGRHSDSPHPQLGEHTWSSGVQKCGGRATIMSRCFVASVVTSLG